jgi:hypothetical protein
MLGCSAFFVSRWVVSFMPHDEMQSDEMRKQIAELLEESRRIRERSEDLAKRIADLRTRIERSDPASSAEH